MSDERGLAFLSVATATMGVAVLSAAAAAALVLAVGLPGMWRYGSRCSRRRGNLLVAVGACAAAFLMIHAGQAIAAPISVARVDRAIDERFGPLGLAGVFRCIGQRESRYQDNPGRALAAVSPTHDHGVLQVHVAWDTQRGEGRLIYGRWYPAKILNTLAGNLDASWRLLTRNGSRHRDLSHWAGGAYPCW